MCILKHGHSLVEDSKAQLTKLLAIWTWLKRNGKAFLGNMKGVRVFMGDDQCVCNCSFPLQDAYCLRLLTHRDLLHRLANPPSAEPNRHNRGLGWAFACVSIFFFFIPMCVCLSLLHSLCLVGVLGPKPCESWHFFSMTQLSQVSQKL